VSVEHQRIKVCVIGSVYPRFDKDTEVPWLRETVNRCRERGCDIEVFAPSWLGLKSHCIDDIKVHRFRYAPAFLEDLTGEGGAPAKIHKLRYKLLTLSYIICGTLGLLRLHRKKRYDILHVHWPFPHGIFSTAAVLFFGGRVVLNFHGAELLLSQKYGFVKKALRFFIKRADRIITNSSFTASKVRAVYSKECAVIPYGSTFEPVRSAGPVKNKQPLVLSVGRLIERKGFSYLIEAAKRVVERIPDVRFVIAGGGPLLDSLRDQVRASGLEKYVSLPGKVAQEELINFYNQASLFVLPAIEDDKGDTEGLGVVLIEALSCKVPVAASSVGGIPDVIKDGRTGILFPQRDSEAIADSITRVLRDDNLKDTLAAQGYEYVIERFGWESAIGEIITLYKNVTNEKKINFSRIKSVKDINWESWNFTERAVLCFVRKGDEILLIHKKTGLGKGKINAPGGRIENGETPEAAAIRETKEETHVTPSSLEFVAEIHFIFRDGYSLRGFAFFAHACEGDPISTPEADPFWCGVDSIPYDKMWADDIHWLPRVLSGEKVLGRFIFDKDKLLDMEVIPIE